MSHPLVDELLEFDEFDLAWRHWYEEGFDNLPDITSAPHAGILLSILEELEPDQKWSIYRHAEGVWVINTLRQTGPSRSGATLGEAVAKMLLTMLKRKI